MFNCSIWIKKVSYVRGIHISNIHNRDGNRDDQRIIFLSLSFYTVENICRRTTFAIIETLCNDFIPSDYIRCCVYESC